MRIMPFTGFMIGSLGPCFAPQVRGTTLNQFAAWTVYETTDSKLCLNSEQFDKWSYKFTEWTSVPPNPVLYILALLSNMHDLVSFVSCSNWSLEEIWLQGAKPFLMGRYWPTPKSRTVEQDQGWRFPLLKIVIPFCAPLEDQ